MKQTATVSASDVADPGEHYYLTYSSMDSAWKNTTFQATLNPNHTLLSVGATISSQVTQIAGNFMVGGLNAAKLAGAMAPPAGPPLCSEDVLQALKTRDKLKHDLTQYPAPANGAKAVAKAPAATASSTPASADKATAEAAILTRLQEKLTIQTTGTFNPSAVGDTAVIRAKSDQFAKWFSGLDDGSLDDVISTTVVLGPNTEPIPQTAKPQSNPILGVVYRDPAPMFLKVCAGSVCSSPTLSTSLSPSDAPPHTNETLIAIQQINVPQLGPYVVMPLRNGWLDNNNIAITFAANGVPTNFAYGKQSTILALSTLLNTGGSSSGSGSSSSGSGGSGGGSSSSGSSGGSKGGK